MSRVGHSIRQQVGKGRSPKSLRRRGRRLAYESLETRELMAVAALQNLSVSEDTGEKPQSKLWEYAGQWWTVMPNSSGTWVHRLDGTNWTPTVQISSNNNVRADVKSIGNLAHVLLLDGSSAQLASLQYDPADNRFESWTLRPQLVNVPLNSSVEMATIDIDSTGKMWVAYDVSSTIEVRHSTGLYNTWSAPITVATGISSDDICVITAMPASAASPGNKIGVMWSNQSSKRFGFRYHVDGTTESSWSTAETAAAQSASGSMADDHLNVAMHSNGTMYIAAKTSYSSPTMVFFVRRPNGVWDNMYIVNGSGTRPIVVLDESANRIIYAYTTNENGGDIVYHLSPADVINFAPRQVLIPGTVNNVTSTKQNFTNDVVFLASGGSSAKGALFTLGAIQPQNQGPTVLAGADQNVLVNTSVTLNGTAFDNDNLPVNGNITTLWTQQSGPGTVTFGNSSLVDTTASFGQVGTYVLRLAASDGQLTSFDQLTVTVAPQVVDNPPPPPPGDQPSQIAFQDGLFPSVTYAGTRDTKLNSGSKTKNYGTATEIKVDGSPDEASLFRWDVSAIPTGSIIVSAAIELNAVSSTNGNFEVYALQRAWDEISATWNRYSSSGNWATAGANGAGDHSTTVLGQFAPPAKGINRITLNNAGVAAVQSWINNAAANFGVILKDYAISDGVSISSSEASNKAQRPKLIINYEPAAALQAAFSSFVEAPANQVPTVDVGQDLTVQLGQSLSLSGFVNDDGMPQAPGLLTTLWSRVSGPGTATFANTASASTSVQFSAAGTYVLRLSVSDGELEGFDELTVTVTQPVQTPVSTPVSRRRPKGG